MQQELMHSRLTVTTPDGLEWVGAPFQVRAAYRRARTVDKTDMTKAWQLLWKVKVPLKVRIFSWLLAKQRLVTRVYRKKWQPDAPADSII